MIDSVKGPVILTDKATIQMELNKYVFDVDVKLSKKEIKTVIEDYYNVKVLGINTHRPPRKKGKAQIKRAIITVKSKLFDF